MPEVKMKKFGICTENIIFVLLLVLYLVALFKTVSSEQNDSSTDTQNEEGSGDTEIQPTPQSMNESNSENEPEMETMSESILKIGLVYQNSETMKMFDEATKFLETNQPDIKFQVVVKYSASKSTDAIGLVKNFCKTIDDARPDMIVDFTQSGIPSEGVKIILKTLRIPTVATASGRENDVRSWLWLSEMEQKYLIRIVPPSDMIDQAVRSLVESQNMTNAAIIFDEINDINHLHKSILIDLPTYHKVTAVSSSDFRYEIQNLIESRFTNFFLIGSPSRISSWIKTIIKSETTSIFNDDEYSWFAISLESGQLTCTKCDGNMSLILMQPQMSTARNLDDEFYFNLAKRTITNAWEMKTDHKWPSTRENIRCTNFNMTREYAEPDVDLLGKFQEHKTDKMFEMSQNGRHHPIFELDIKKMSYIEPPNSGKPGTGNIVEESVGTWSAGHEGKKLIKFEPTNQLGSYGTKTVYKVVTVVNPPYVYRKPNCSNEKLREKNPYDHCFYGYSIDLLNQNADLAIGALTLLPERELVVDFTRPHHPPVEFTFIVRIPPVPEHLFQFMTVGGGEAPRGLSGRLVASTWWLFSFIIIASYTANLAAFLTVSRLVKPIQSLEDLINQHRVLYFPVVRSSAWFYFDRMAYVEEKFYEAWRDLSLEDDLSEYNRSLLAVWTYPNSDKYTRIWQNMMENHPPKNIDEAVKLVIHGNKSNEAQKFALIGEETDLKYLTQVHCEVKLVGETFSHRPYAMAVQKGSPLREQINAVLDELERKRELEKIYKAWWEQNPHDKKCPRAYDVADGINLANLGGIFLVGIGGMVATVIAILFEILYCKIYNSHAVQSLSDCGEGMPKPRGYRRLLRWIFFDTKKPNVDGT